MTVLAQTTNQATGDLLDRVNTVIVNPVLLFLMALGVLFFLYGLLEFVAAGDSEEKRKTGRDHMVWGVFGLFIMVSVFGIINIVINTVNTLGS